MGAETPHSEPVKTDLYEQMYNPKAPEANRSPILREEGAAAEAREVALTRAIAAREKSDAEHARMEAEADKLFLTQLSGTDTDTDFNTLPPDNATSMAAQNERDFALPPEEDTAIAKTRETAPKKPGA